jgi:hypothetical protein
MNFTTQYLRWLVFKTRVEAVLEVVRCNKNKDVTRTFYLSVCNSFAEHLLPVASSKVILTMNIAQCLVGVELKLQVEETHCRSSHANGGLHFYRKLYSAY